MVALARGAGRGIKGLRGTWPLLARDLLALLGGLRRAVMLDYAPRLAPSALGALVTRVRHAVAPAGEGGGWLAADQLWRCDMEGGGSSLCWELSVMAPPEIDNKLKFWYHRIMITTCKTKCRNAAVRVFMSIWHAVLCMTLRLRCSALDQAECWTRGVGAA